MSLIFTVLATSTTPASITVPITAVGFHTLEVIPPTGHTWTEYDQDGGTATVSRPLDHREIIHRPYRIIYRVREEQKVIEILRVWHAARGIPRIHE